MFGAQGRIRACVMSDRRFVSGGFCHLVSLPLSLHSKALCEFLSHDVLSSPPALPVRENAVIPRSSPSAFHVSGHTSVTETDPQSPSVWDKKSRTIIRVKMLILVHKPFMHFPVPKVKGIEPSENWLTRVSLLSNGEYETLALPVWGLK